MNQSQSGKWSVLLVEDHDATREALATYLERVGFSVAAVGEAEAVPSAREANGRPFDVLVSDVHLPGMSGIELASLMLAAVPGHPIVLITSDPDEALAREALSRGPVSYLLKPFELFELEAAIRNTLAAHQQRQQQQPPARSQSSTPVSTIGGIPASWLKWVDDRSYAGPGHADRLVRAAKVLHDVLPDLNVDFEDVRLAAQCHELGFMSGAASEPIELAFRGAELLRDLGGSRNVALIVKHMHERWDGTGGPDQLRAEVIPAGARLLSVVDAIDHYSIAWMQAGLTPAKSVDRAIGLMVAQQGSVFENSIVRAVFQQRDAISRICGVERATPLPAEIPLARSNIIPTVATALLGRF